MGFSLASLYSWCCCSTSDGSEAEYGNAKKSHPREQQVDDAFKARGYMRDDSGRFTVNNSSSGQMQPTLPPLPELRPLDPLEPFKDMRRSIDPGRPEGSATVPGKENGGGAAQLRS